LDLKNDDDGFDFLRIVWGGGEAKESTKRKRKREKEK